MIVKCPSCASKFRIPDERVRAEGVMVRCSRCKKVFRVRRPPPAEGEATVRRPTPLPHAPVGPPAPDGEATRVVRDPLAEAGILDDLSGPTDPGSASGHPADFDFDLAADIPDPAFDIPYAESDEDRESSGGWSSRPGSGAATAPPAESRGRDRRFAPFGSPAGAAPSSQAAGLSEEPAEGATPFNPPVDEDDLSSLLSLAFPAGASTEPGEADLAVLEARTVPLDPTQAGDALGSAESPMEAGLAPFDAAALSFDPLAESAARAPSKPVLAVPAEEPSSHLELDLDLDQEPPAKSFDELTATEPRARAQAPLAAPPADEAPAPASSSPGLLLDLPEAAPEPVAPRAPTPSASMPVAAVSAAPSLSRLTAWLSALVGLLLLALGFFGYLAARNDWLLDLGDMDQMLGVAFRGATYQPRVSRTVRVYELDEGPVRHPVEQPVETRPPAPLSVQNLVQRQYPTQQGEALVVIEGDVVNASDRPQRRIFVRARLLRGDQEVASAVVPVGRNLTEEELERAAVPEALQGIYERVAHEAEELVLNPNQRSRFTAAFPRSDSLGDETTLTYAVDVVEAQSDEGENDWHRLVLDPSRLEAAPR